MTGPEMVAHAKALGPVIVCEDNSGRRAPSDTGTSSIVWALTAAGDAEIRGVA